MRGISAHTYSSNHEAQSDKAYHHDGLCTNTQLTDMASPASLVDKMYNQHNDKCNCMSPCMVYGLNYTQSYLQDQCALTYSSRCSCVHMHQKANNNAWCPSKKSRSDTCSSWWDFGPTGLGRIEHCRCRKPNGLRTIAHDFDGNLPLVAALL